LEDLDDNSRSWFDLWYSRKNGKKPFDSTCKVEMAKVVSEYVGARENGART